MRNHLQSALAHMHTYRERGRQTSIYKYLLQREANRHRCDMKFPQVHSPWYVFKLSTVAFLPSRAKLPSALYYFTGSCEISLDQIRTNFITALLSSTWKDACVNVATCTAENVQVMCHMCVCQCAWASCMEENVQVTQQHVCVCKLAVYTAENNQ